MAFLVIVHVLCQSSALIEPSLHQLDFFLESFLWRLNRPGQPAGTFVAVIIAFNNCNTTLQK